jgi:hypothetical protein
VSFAAYAVHEDYRLATVDGALALLIVGTGAGFYASSNASSTVRFSSAAILGTGLVYGGLVIADASMQRPISAASLARHHERLERRGDQVGDAELAAMERDFARTVRPIPRWVFPLTLAVGGITAAAPVFSNDTSSDDRTLALVLGNLLITPAVASILPLVTSDRTGYRSYEQALRNLQLTPVGPASSLGMTVSGRF